MPPPFQIPSPIILREITHHGNKAVLLTAYVEELIILLFESAFPYPSVSPEINSITTTYLSNHILMKYAVLRLVINLSQIFPPVGKTSFLIVKGQQSCGGN